MDHPAMPKPSLHRHEPPTSPDQTAGLRVWVGSMAGQRDQEASEHGGHTQARAGSVLQCVIRWADSDGLAGDEARDDVWPCSVIGSRG